MAARKEKISSTAGPDWRQSPIADGIVMRKSEPADGEGTNASSEASFGSEQPDPQSGATKKVIR